MPRKARAESGDGSGDGPMPPSPPAPPPDAPLDASSSLSSALPSATKHLRRDLMLRRGASSSCSSEASGAGDIGCRCGAMVCDGMLCCARLGVLHRQNARQVGRVLQQQHRSACEGCSSIAPCDATRPGAIGDPAPCCALLWHACSRRRQSALATWPPVTTCRGVMTDATPLLTGFDRATDRSAASRRAAVGTAPPAPATPTRGGAQEDAMAHRREVLPRGACRKDDLPLPGGPCRRKTRWYLPGRGAQHDAMAA